MAPAAVEMYAIHGSIDNLLLIIINDCAKKDNLNLVMVNECVRAWEFHG